MVIGSNKQTNKQKTNQNKNKWTWIKAATAGSSTILSKLTGRKTLKWKVIRLFVFFPDMNPSPVHAIGILWKIFSHGKEGNSAF